ncbi:MAG: saccharopine dehydrogenase C-terminal domain-containing protein [Anaerolineae bacterium]
MNIVVLGGAGLMGRFAVRDLVLNPEVDQVIIADLDVDLARQVASILDSPKLKVQYADATDHASLVSILKGADSLLNATVYYFNLSVMEACLEAGVHYVDMGGLFYTTRKQLDLHERFRAAGITAVLGMGSAPGIPNVQAHYAAQRLDTIESIRIYDGIKPPPGDDIFFGYAVPTIIDELTMPPMVYRNGEFIACDPLSEPEEYWFEPPIGVLKTHLSLHSEVATLPLTFADKGVKECFFKINYWGLSEEALLKIKLFADVGLASNEPVEVKGVSVRPRDLLVKLMAPYTPPLDAFMVEPADPTDWKKEIVTEVTGAQDGQRVTYRLGTLTAVGSRPTGVAPAIIAVWLASGRIWEAGVFPSEAVIDPEPFFAELARRGIHTRVTVTRSLA